jgi:hypothetical protein
VVQLDLAPRQVLEPVPLGRVQHSHNPEVVSQVLREFFDPYREDAVDAHRPRETALQDFVVVFQVFEVAVDDVEADLFRFGLVQGLPVQAWGRVKVSGIDVCLMQSKRNGSHLSGVDIFGNFNNVQSVLVRVLHKFTRNCVMSICCCSLIRSNYYLLTTVKIHHIDHFCDDSSA